MYICLECGAVFEQPKRTIERFEHSRMTIKECPRCQSQAFEIATTCEICGAYIGQEQARYGMCAQCEMDTDADFKKSLSRYNEKQIEYLNNQYDGRYFE